MTSVAPTRCLLAGVLTCLVGLMSAGCATQAPPPTVLDRLQGTWEGDGPSGHISITIQGSSLHFFAREDFWYRTRFTLPAATEPQELHATIEESSADDAGEKVLAILEVDAGKLTLATDGGSEQAPASFEAASSRYELERVPAAK